jgi:hypothetical protein
MAKTLVASVKEFGDHIYITTPVSLYVPEAAEIETFAFAENVKTLAPNPNILWLKGQYVEADAPNRNGDEWTAGELTIKALTPVLMPVTVMHNLASAVGTIADAKLLTPQADQVPRARIDTMLALWAHRFPEIAAETKVNAQQGTLMQSMECLSPYYDCSLCGQMLHRHAKWEQEWKGHVAGHPADVAISGRSAARILRNVTFSGVGLIFGTRGARGAMPSAHLEVEELAALHREAHSGTTAKRSRRANTVDIDDTKYEALVAAKADGESKVGTLTAEVAAKDKTIETLEAKVVTLEAAKTKAEGEAETAKETARVAAMRDERMTGLGTGFRAKLDKLETTSKLVAAQAAKYTDEEWAARLTELEETLAIKRDAKLDAAAAPKLDADGKPIADPKLDADGKPIVDATAGLLFDRSDVAASAVTTATAEVTAGETTEPSLATRQSVMGGLVKRPARATRDKAKA